MYIEKILLKKYIFISACFGQVLNPNYKLYIDNFSNEVQKLNISVTPNIHTLIFHVPAK